MTNDDRSEPATNTPAPQPASPTVPSSIVGQGSLLSLPWVITSLWATTQLPTAMLGASGLLALLLSYLTYTDFTILRLPNLAVGALAIAGAATHLLAQTQGLLWIAAGAAAGYGVLTLIRTGYRFLRGREGLGGGDPKLFGAIGAWVGIVGLPSVLLIAAMSGLTMALLTRSSWRDPGPMAFGPHLAFGAWLVWALGPLQVT